MNVTHPTINDLHIGSVNGHPVVDVNTLIRHGVENVLNAIPFLDPSRRIYGISFADNPLVPISVVTSDLYDLFVTNSQESHSPFDGVTKAFAVDVLDGSTSMRSLHATAFDNRTAIVLGSFKSSGIFIPSVINAEVCGSAPPNYSDVLQPLSYLRSYMTVVDIWKNLNPNKPIEIIGGFQAFTWIVEECAALGYVDAWRSPHSKQVLYGLLSSPQEAFVESNNKRHTNGNKKPRARSPINENLMFPDDAKDWSR